jgi:hypothetical protein
MRTHYYHEIISFSVPILVSLIVLFLEVNAWILLPVFGLILYLTYVLFDNSRYDEEIIGTTYISIAISMLMVAMIKKPVFNEIILIIWLIASIVLVSLYLLEKAQSNFEGFKRQNLDNTVISVVKLLVITASLFLTLLYFGTQFIWLPTIAFILITISDVEFNNCEFNWKEDFDIIGGIILIIIGIISTLWQYADKIIDVILSLDFLYYKIILGVIILFFIFKVIRKLRIKAKTAKEDARRKKKSQDDMLKLKKEIEEKNEERRKKEEEIKGKILSNMQYKPKGLITVSNIKRKIVWGEEMRLALKICNEIFNQSFDDRELKKTIHFLNSILHFVANEKKVSEIYEGEKEIRERITLLLRSVE